MPHDPKKLLFDLIDACKKIMTFTDGVSYEMFTQSDLIKSAVHMQFVIIGEALMRLRSTDPSLYGRITDADRIIAFPDF